jgi:FAD/FMN-containing dehydrogenase
MQSSSPIVEIVPGISPHQQRTFGAVGYDDWRQQYATSSCADKRRMCPGIIIQALNATDIKNVISYATNNKKAIAIRSGGHQYSGASSTGLHNIQLDLRHTFKSEPQDLKCIVKGSDVYVRAGVSWSLSEFNSFFRKE